MIKQKYMRNLILFLFLCIDFVAYTQTIEDLRKDYASNILTLDPIEGEYDVEAFGEYITPFVHQNLKQKKFKMWIVRDNNDFIFYVVLGNGNFKSNVQPNEEAGIHTLYRIEPIGDTNAYWFSFDTSTTRIYLQNRNHFEAKLQLDNNSAKKFTGNRNLSSSVNIFPSYDFIKVYPTSSMYADALRKKVEEESKPTSWTGTGFALNSNYVVTNYHVVEEAKTISIQGVNGNFNRKYSATVVGTDKYNDLAVLKVNGVSIPSAGIPYTVKTTTSDVGENIFVLGYPLTSTMGDEIKLTTGVISSKTGFQGDVSLYQISAPVQPGNSGGPLFDSKGNVIGIVSAKHKGAENVGYAIKTSYLRNLLESVLSAAVLPKTNKIAGLNLSGKVKSLKNYVYYITCSKY